MRINKDTLTVIKAATAAKILSERWEPTTAIILA